MPIGAVYFKDYSDKYKVYQQLEDGSLVEMYNGFSALTKGDANTATSKFYILPADGMVINSIKINGTELNDNYFDAFNSNLKYDG